MGLSRVLARLASRAPVPLFAVAGGGAREAISKLQISPAVDLVDTPAAANILLLGGSLPAQLTPALATVHDALPDPRCTVLWPLGADQAFRPSGDRAVTIGLEDDPIQVITAAYRALLAGMLPSEQTLQPDADRQPWRGIGPYGQGGSGMTGGVPYGRPMAELAADRDGLRLDTLPLSIGPFFPRFRAGLTLDVSLAGDVVVEARLADSPFVVADGGQLSGPFVRAISEPVAIATLELARAREHLLWAADALATHGLPVLAMRILRLALALTPRDGDAVRSLARRLRSLGVPRLPAAGVGRLSPDVLAGLALGPISRAAGHADDARRDDPAYVRLGFDPIVMHAGDAAARWELRLAEAAQALDLARRAGALRTQQTGVTESPRGRLGPNDAPFGRLRPLVPDLLAGLEWGDAITSVVSLDLDPHEAGAVASAATPRPAAA